MSYEQKKWVASKEARKAAKEKRERNSSMLADNKLDWFCDWCGKGMKEQDAGVSDKITTFCSQECCDEKHANE